jgi:hypothetical protein
MSARFNDAGVEADIERLRPIATKLLYGYDGDNDFLVSVQGHPHALTVRQVRGVLNCMRVEYPARVQKALDAPWPPPPEPVRYVPTEQCPLLGTDHDRHWFPLEHRSGSQHCVGWHAMTREIVRVRARFHPPYLRGRNSNLIHRSTHEGEVTWFPERFHQPGPHRLASWEVRPRCTPGAAWLRSPEVLTAEGVRAAVPYVPNHEIKHKEITLCLKCFPTGGAPAVLTP